MRQDEDKDLKALFSNYRPVIPDSDMFLRRLTEKAAALEGIRDYHINVRRRNRVAILAAAGAGFLTGVIFTLLFPWILRLCSAAAELLTELSIHLPVRDFALIVTWCIIAGMVVLISLTTYNYTLAEAGKKV